MARENPPQSDGTVDEIVVTATRQSLALSRVPVSVSAFTQEMLDAKGVRDVGDIARITPGLQLQKTPNGSNISIRGISSTAGAATTGIYIDDTPVQIRGLGYGGANAYPRIFDLERIEVLRGPQGTLFGAGSEGGTVRFLTPEASLTRYSAYGRAEVSGAAHGDPNYEAGLAVGGPIVEDKLGFRVSGWYRRDGGYIDRRSVSSAQVEENANYSDSYVGRAALAWAPTPQLKITPSIFYQNLKQNDSDFYWEDLSDSGAGQLVNGNPSREFNHDRFVLPALNATYSAGAFDVAAIVSYFDRTQRNDVDYTLMNQSIFTGVTLPTLPGQHSEARFRNTQKNYTGELRIQSSDPGARLKWVAGVFASQSKQTALQQVADTYFPTYFQNAYGIPYTFVFPPLIDGELIYDQLSRTKDEQLAVFGQMDYRITQKFSLTLGARLARTTFDITANAAGPTVGGSQVDTGSKKETPFTPKFGVNYQVDDANLLYATASKGFRPGGYNPAVGTVCAGALGAIGLSQRPALYDADTVWNYELGTKNRLFDRRLQIEASVYQIDWKNIQQTVFLTRCGFSFVNNLGDARSRGFDVQARLAVTPDLQVSASVGHNHAKFRSTVYGGPAAVQSIVAEGDSIVNPPWTISLSGQYDFSLPGDRASYVRVDYDYRSHQDAVTPNVNPADASADLTIGNPPASHIVSVRAGTRFDKVELSLFVQNLFDEDAWTTKFRFNPIMTVYRIAAPRPRTIGVTAALRY